MEKNGVKKLGLLFISFGLCILVPGILYTNIFGDFNSLTYKDLVKILLESKFPHFFLLIIRPLGVLLLLPASILIYLRLNQLKEYSSAIYSLVASICSTLLFGAPLFTYTLLKYKYAIEVALAEDGRAVFTKSSFANILPAILEVIDTVALEQIGFLSLSLTMLLFSTGLYKITKNKLIYYSGIIISSLKIAIIVIGYIFWELKYLLIEPNDITSLLIFLWFIFSGSILIYMNKEIEV